MANKYLDDDGLRYLWSKITGKFVEQESGKGLSTNDYTTAEKNKLAGVASGAEVNVQADWNETSSSSDAFIKNKPTIPPAVTVDSAISSTSENPVQNKVIYTALDGKVDKVSGKGLSTNDYTTAEKNKLSGIATGAEVNQNAFSNVKVTVGTTDTTIAADSKTDTLTIIQGSNITFTPDASGDSLTIAATDTTYSEATTSAAGLMSASDKTKLNGIATGAQVNQNAFSNVAVGSTTIAADSTTDTLTVAGTANLITVTANATSDTLTFNVGSNVITTSKVGAASGVCPLDSSGKVDSSYLPSYVDDVIEGYPRSGQTELSQNWLATGSASGSVIVPESGKIYILMAATTNYKQYDQFRWGGTTYVKISDGNISAITNAEIDAIVTPT